MITRRIFLAILACCAFAFSCASAKPAKQQPKSSPAQAEQPAKAEPKTLPEQIAPSSEAPKVAQGVQLGEVPSSDYLPEGVLLVGNRTASWQGDLYRVPFYTAKIITPASEATKGEAEVQATGKVEGSADGRFWSSYIVSSRPAKKEDLVPGVFVFAMGDSSPRSRADLARTTEWSLFRIKDVSNLYKGTVILEFYDTYWSAWKTGEYHLDNIRLILGDFSAELKQ